MPHPPTIAPVRIEATREVHVLRGRRQNMRMESIDVAETAVSDDRADPAGSESLFVNYVYFAPIGHVIEALHYCHGYHVANPDLRIALALNANSPLELVGLCPYVDTLYPVTLDPADAAADPADELARVPRAWDHVVQAWYGEDPDTVSEFP